MIFQISYFSELDGNYAIKLEMEKKFEVRNLSEKIKVSRFESYKTCLCQNARYFFFQFDNWLYNQNRLMKNYKFVDKPSIFKVQILEYWTLDLTL